MISCVSGVVRVMPHSICGVSIRARQRRERLGRIVARLHLDRRPVDRRAIEPRRRSGLEPAEREAEPLERVRKPDRRRFADPTRRRLRLADMDQAAQERAGGQDRRAAGELAAVHQAHAGHGAIGDQQVVDLAFDHREIFRLADRALHRLGVELAVGLGARAAHRRTLAAIEYAELDSALVGDPAHQAVERIDLAHQMALAEPADRRVAGHRPDRREPVRDQRGPRAHARGRGRGLAAGVPAADHDHIEGSHGITRSGLYPRDWF